MQKVHAVFVAAFFTSIFAGAYLYIMYGVTPPTPDFTFDDKKTYSRQEVLNADISFEEVQKKENERVLDDAANIFLNIKNSFGELNNILESSKKEYISNTKDQNL